MIKELFIIIRSLKKHKASKEQYYLEIGSFLLRRGTGYKVGDAFMLPQQKKGKSVKTQVWISNLFFDFAKNKITHTFTTKNPLTNANKG